MFRWKTQIFDGRQMTIPEGFLMASREVRSALHMVRAERVFKKVFPEYTIVPVPVGYQFNYLKKSKPLENFIPSSGSLQISRDALHEWIGMIWYVGGTC